jgi:hypothetical protein
VNERLSLRADRLEGAAKGLEELDRIVPSTF